MKLVKEVVNAIHQGVTRQAKEAVQHIDLKI